MQHSHYTKIEVIINSTEGAVKDGIVLPHKTWCAKKNTQFKCVKYKRRLSKNILSDATIELTGFYPKQYYPERLRLVKFWDEKQER